jgi:hypothetical protein
MRAGRDNQEDRTMFNSNHPPTSLRLALTLLAGSGFSLLAGCEGMPEPDPGAPAAQQQPAPPAAGDTGGPEPTFLGKTAAQRASAEAVPGHDDVEKTGQELVSQWIPCGQARAFPTWSFWGWTTAEAVNFAPNTRVRLAYQAGAGGTQYIEVSNFAQWGGRWAGFSLWVTYLGWYDSSGFYRSCIQDAPPPADAPTLFVQTY